MGLKTGFRLSLVCGCAILAGAWAQEAAAPAFDAVSIKLSPDGPRGSFVTRPGQNGRWSAQSTLSQLIAFAYDLHCCDLAVEDGPAWVKSQVFSIQATMPAATVPDDDQRAMVRQLLADRFHLVTHAGTDTVPVDTLDAAPGGPKLKPAASTCNLAMVLATNDPPQPCGFTIRPLPGSDRIVFSARSVTMEYMADVFEWIFTPQLGERRPVIDRTGLTGRYDFDVTVAMPPAPQEGSSESSLDRMSDEFLALEKALAAQAGLRLELFKTEKAPIPVQIVDSAAMPAN